MKVLTFDSADAAATALATRVARAVHDCPQLVIGLPAGRTMIPVYAALRRLRQPDGFERLLHPLLDVLEDLRGVHATPVSSGGWSVPLPGIVAGR